MIKSIRNFLIISVIFQQLKSQISQFDKNDWLFITQANKLFIWSSLFCKNVTVLPKYLTIQALMSGKLIPNDSIKSDIF